MSELPLVDDPRQATSRAQCSECGWWHVGHRPTSPAGIAAVAARDMKTSSAYRKPRTETT